MTTETVALGTIELGCDPVAARPGPGTVKAIDAIPAAATQSAHVTESYYAVGGRRPERQAAGPLALLSSTDRPVRELGCRSFRRRDRGAVPRERASAVPSRLLRALWYSRSWIFALPSSVFARSRASRRRSCASTSRSSRRYAASAARNAARPRSATSSGAGQCRHDADRRGGCVPGHGAVERHRHRSDESAKSGCEGGSRAARVRRVRDRGAETDERVGAEDHAEAADDRDHRARCPCEIAPAVVDSAARQRLVAVDQVADDEEDLTDAKQHRRAADALGRAKRRRDHQDKSEQPEERAVEGGECAQRQRPVEAALTERRSDRDRGTRDHERIESRVSDDDRPADCDHDRDRHHGQGDRERDVPDGRRCGYAVSVLRELDRPPGAPYAPARRSPREEKPHGANLSRGGKGSPPGDDEHQRHRRVEDLRQEGPRRSADRRRPVEQEEREPCARCAHESTIPRPVGAKFCACAFSVGDHDADP